MEIEANPFASPAVVDDVYETAVIAEKGTGDWNEQWDRIILVGIVLTCVFGAILSFVNIETIVFSGPILIGLSACLICREVVLRRRGRPAWVLAQTVSVIGIVIPLVILAMIAINEWSPEEAKNNGVPFYVVLTAPLVVALCVLAYFRIPQKSE